MPEKVIKESTKDKINASFIEYILDNGRKPISIYAFCKALKIKESAFYDEYSSFDHVESNIWKSFFVSARNTAEAEEVYASYTVREKLLGILYTWVEVLKTNRSFVLMAVESLDRPIFSRKNTSLADFKIAFIEFASELLMEARENREVEPRAIPQLMQKYPDLLWAETLFILDFWVKDTSKSFEKTDTIIEKAVNTTFDLLARSPLDSLLDLGKFIFQNRK